jgi:hypothetical protein
LTMFFGYADQESQVIAPPLARSMPMRTVPLASSSKSSPRGPMLGVAAAGGAGWRGRNAWGNVDNSPAASGEVSRSVGGRAHHRKPEDELLTTDDTDYTDNVRIGFVCIHAIGVIRG